MTGYIDPADEIRAVLAEYDLGELAGFERNERGFVNTSFAIETQLNGLRTRRFLRKYKGSIQEEEIRFEHSVIHRLLEQGNIPVAKVHLTRQGKSYIQHLGIEDNVTGNFFAIFDFLSGEDRYTWIAPRCTPAEVESAAATLARFHAALQDFVPQGKRQEPRILDLLPVTASNIQRNLSQPKGSIFDACLKENASLLLDSIQATLDMLHRPEIGQLPENIIHCDFHPGNLKFQCEEVAGLFDFDWAKVDYRCFDLGLALWYFFARWEGDQDGCLDLELTRHFLVSYQRTLKSIPAARPLTTLECHMLPAMINAGNLYVLNWTIEDFYYKIVDPQEYLPFLLHSVNSAKWLADPDNAALLASECAFIE